MGLKNKISNLAIWFGTGAEDANGNPTFKNTTIERGGPSKAIKYPKEESPLVDRIEWNLEDADADPVFLIEGDHWKQGAGDVPDATLRGGITANLSRRGIDFKRFEKFALTPTGMAFLERQTGLQAMNPKIKAPMEGIFGNSPANQRTYNLGINTLAQIEVAGVENIKREGLLLGIGPDGYEDDKEFLERTDKNRLIYLYNNKITTREASKTEGGGLGGLISKGLNFIGGKGEMLYDYIAGPGSIFGVGRTFIGRYTNTNEQGLNNDFNKHIARDLLNFQKTQGGLPSWVMPEPPKLADPDVDSKITGEDEEITPAESNKNPTRELKYNLGDPGKDSLNRTRYQTEQGKHKSKGLLNYNTGMDIAFGAIDKLNALTIIKKTNNVVPEEIAKYLDDYVKMQFEVIDQTNTSSTNLIAFRAFIDSIGDDYNASHNEFKYNGRGESFYVYSKFKRQIGLKFKIAAQTRHEMKPLYQKLNYLAAQTAPQYSSGGRIMTPFMRVTVGDWFNRIPGIVNSVSLGWQKDYTWEIKADDVLDADMLVLPHVLDVNFTFTPIHDFLPSNAMNTPFLGINSWGITQPTTTLKSALYQGEIGEDLRPSATANTNAKVTPEKKKKEK